MEVGVYACVSSNGTQGPPRAGAQVLGGLGSYRVLWPAISCSVVLLLGWIWVPVENTHLFSLTEAELGSRFR